MATDLHKLFILKAYYMGHAISEKKSGVQQAIAMADAAITELEDKNDEQNRLHLLFYILLKTEILRATSDISELRKRAKKISQELSLPIYEDYMMVEDATQTRKKAYGLETGVIADKGVQTTVSYTVTDGYNVWLISYDAACRALNVDENSLSDQEMHFLHKTTLKEMLERIRLDCESEANHNLNRLLDEPMGSVEDRFI